MNELILGDYRIRCYNECYAWALQGGGWRSLLSGGSIPAESHTMEGDSHVNTPGRTFHAEGQQHKALGRGASLASCRDSTKAPQAYIKSVNMDFLLFLGI